MTRSAGRPGLEVAVVGSGLGGLAAACVSRRAATP